MKTKWMALALLALGACASAPSPVPIASPSSAASASTDAPTVSAARTGTLVTYKSGRELWREEYRDDGETLVSQLSLAGRTAVIRTSRRSRTVEIDEGSAHVERDIPPDTLALENGDWQAYAIAAEWYADARTPTPVHVLVPGQGVTAEGEITVTSAPDGGRHVTLKIGPLTLTADVAKNGSVVAARVPLQALEVRSLTPSPSSSPVAPAASQGRGGDAEAIEIRQGDRVLAGELLVPKGAPRPLPLVVIVPGSGPTDRDGNNRLGLHTDTYKQIALQAAKRGIATLRYDKRGVGQSTGVREGDITLTTSTHDLETIVREAQQKDRFSTLVLAGHSEGGLVALTAFRALNASALVLLATPGRPLGQVLRDQLVRAGVAPAEIDGALTAARRGQIVATDRKELELIFRATALPFLTSLLDVDPSELFRSTTVPATIVQGDADRQVSVEDAKLLYAARPDARLLIVHDMSHTLKNDAATGPIQPSYTDPNVPLASGVVDALVEAARR